MSEARREPVAVLCGGLGTRLREEGSRLPKPLVEIGGRPIVWHVVNAYAARGFERFLLLTGHQAELIERFARDADWPAGTSVECVMTGEDTPTGGRVYRALGRLGDGTFCVAYADGLSDLDLAELADWHGAHDAIATMCVVQPELQFGVAELDGDGRVSLFKEKPPSEHWVNGGFFCFDPGVADYLDDSAVLERRPLERLASDGQLYGYRHRGFWRCMDTYKEAAVLNRLWADGAAPWRVWEDEG